MNSTSINSTESKSQSLFSMGVSRSVPHFCLALQIGSASTPGATWDTAISQVLLTTPPK
jgi:hypothetical protein